MIYNATLRRLQENPKLVNNKYGLRDELKTLAKRAIDKINMPNTSVEYAVWEAMLAFKQSHDAADRTNKMTSYSVSIDGRAIKNGYIYSTNVKKFLSKKYAKSKVKKIYNDCKVHSIRNINTSSVCKLIYKQDIDRFYLTVPETQRFVPKPKREFIALDPGVRTFMSFYDGQSFGEIGKDVSQKLYNINLQIDKLKSRRTHAKGYKKLKLKLTIARLQARIKNIVKDLHYKTRNFLNQYKYIILPKFNVSQMIKNLPPIVKRMMLDLAHFKFKTRLAQQSSKNRKVILCNEAWTSKTCTGCGTLNNTLGTKKLFKCPSCELCIDRDFNGARNILLRVLSIIGRDNAP
jgi:transposase